MGTVVTIKRLEIVGIEVPIDPHSLFWYYHQEVDPYGDPLDVMILAESGDEVALALMRGEGVMQPLPKAA